MNWNSGWSFHRGALHAEQVKDEDALRSVSDWETVDVPHDFQIAQPWVKPDSTERRVHFDGASFQTRLSARGFKEMGEGWYVKLYTPDKTLQGKRILLDFEGIMYVGDVYLNGERVGGTEYGYVGFEIDLSRRLRYGQSNVIAVRAGTGAPMNSRWYTGGGLFRDVHLVVTDAHCYLARHPLYVTTSQNRWAHLQVEVVNTPGETTVDLETCIKDATGNVLYRQRKRCPFFSPVEAHDIDHIPSNEIRWDSIDLGHPHLWSCESPYLYTAEVTLFDKAGSVTDHASTRFGVRTVEFGPDFGFKLNGQKVLLQGNANHHTLGALGAAAYPKAMEKRLKLLKEFGFNHIRTSHNPYSTSFLDLCDSLGIIVVDEIYDKWVQQYTGGRSPWLSHWADDVTEWVKRDRNHPSVVMWDLGNELQTLTTMPFNDFGRTAYRLMKEVILRYDQTRKLTAVMHPRGRTLEVDGQRVVGLRPMKERPEVDLPSPLAMESDIASYNYSYDYFEKDGNRFPHMVFYQSEANTNSMGRNFYGMNLDKVVGLAYWGQIDYLGESRGWPVKGWAQGTFDISLQPKPQAYLLKSMFKPEEPVVHIGIVERKADDEIWNGVKTSIDGLSDHWNRTPGRQYDVKVFTNCDSVILKVNGKRVGMQCNSTTLMRNQLLFPQITYQPGTIEAIGYRNGRKVATHRVETTGTARKLVLQTEDEVWMADGQDLLHIRVWAVDSKGRRAVTAQEQLTFRVEGDARIVAVDNGNLSSDESYVGSTRSLYNGSALVILRAGKQAGEVTLTVTSPAYRTESIRLQMR